MKFNLTSIHRPEGPVLMSTNVTEKTIFLLLQHPINKRKTPVDHDEKLACAITYKLPIALAMRITIKRKLARREISQS